MSMVPEALMTLDQLDNELPNGFHDAEQPGTDGTFPEISLRRWHVCSCALLSKFHHHTLAYVAGFFSNFCWHPAQQK